MTRFDRAFHQSDFHEFTLCPRMFYYHTVLGIDQERISEVALAGSALHTVIATAHADHMWDAETLFTLFKEELERQVHETLLKDIEVRRGVIDLEDYRQMLLGYISQPWNREAEVTLSECAFFFEVKPSSTRYQFAGRIDHIIRLPTQLLAAEFPIFHSFSQTDVVIHRDIKTGQRRGVRPFALLLNDQISIYAYALKYGNFDRDHDGIPEAHLDLIPDFHALYFLSDHIPYKRPPKGKEGLRRGPGMYFTERPLERLALIPKELMLTCASIRRGDFPREGAARGICEYHCAVRHTCEADLLQEIR